MGVHQLWTIVAPCGRPIKLETLNQRRLAVDASIWIYQFLKAVRDKEGNVLRNSHIVGFYYRICKLLYHGIKPVFVFDGGAPALKRRVITERKKRREGKRDDAVRTAGRLLAVQMQRRAEEEQQRARDSRGQPTEEEPLPEELAYADELGMSTKEKQKSRQFKKKDQYHLPDLDVSLAEMGGPNDPRVMSQEELAEYARQFKNGEDVSFYDFSKIDFDSPMFTSLPAADRYNILNAKRLRSRLRMGYSKEQLAQMFPNSMAFSRFQMERVRERNELTQRLMNINGMAEDFAYQTGRIAGEKGKEYILVQNSAAEGGWALGVIQRDEPIDVDADEPSPKLESDSEEDDDFEDVPVEGLNRLPRKWTESKQSSRYEPSNETAAQHIGKKRRAVYEARKKAIGPPAPREQPGQLVTDDKNTLFIADDNRSADTNPTDEPDDLFEDVDLNQTNSDDDLQKAIQMSLEQPTNDLDTGHILQSDEGSDDGMDLQAALEESRKSKYRPTEPLLRRTPSPQNQTPSPQKVKTSGALPFESLDLGQSILGQKRAERIRETQSGGFDRDENIKKKSQPLPPWFNTETRTGESMREEQVGQVDEESLDEEPVVPRQAIQRNETKEIIDVDAEEGRIPEVIDVGADGESSVSYGDSVPRGSPLSFQASLPSSRTGPVDSAPQIEDLAEHVKAKPPVPDTTPRDNISAQEHPEQALDQVPDEDEPVEWSESDREETPRFKQTIPKSNDLQIAEAAPSAKSVRNGDSVEDPGDNPPRQDQHSDGEDDALFVDIDPPPPLIHEETLDLEEQAVANQYLIQEEPDVPNNEPRARNQAAEASDHYDSDTDEELFAGLAAEAEANAQFASGLNQRSAAENLAVYEDELKRLRAQQKRDRRDADEVTNNMTEEVQILLGLFGLPYITAPMEAEAQCAELVRLGLVDGVVTDDSDIFLFGGTRVYKNFFNGKKNVELYLASDLEKEYNLTRDKLIASAQILGSDYAEHLKGIGPVKALELLSEWGSLPSFRTWWDTHQLRDPKDIKSDSSLNTERKKFHKRFASTLFLPANWPSQEVEKAYYHPAVDSDTQRFEWGVPQLSRLRDFFMATIGWSPARTDEILVPIVRDMAKREREGTQANVTRYFGGSGGTGSAATRVTVGGGAGGGGGTGRGEVGASTRRVESSRMARALGRLKRREEESMNTEAEADANGTTGGGHDADADTEPEAPKRRRRGKKADADIDAASGHTQRGTKKRKTKAKAAAAAA